jgi:hypothetical protein
MYINRKRNCLTEKRRFKTADQAKEVLKTIRYKHLTEKHPIRYYECYFCKGYHLTSQQSKLEESYGK